MAKLPNSPSITPSLPPQVFTQLPSPSMAMSHRGGTNPINQDTTYAKFPDLSGQPSLADEEMEQREAQRSTDEVISFVQKS